MAKHKSDSCGLWQMTAITKDQLVFNFYLLVLGSIYLERAMYYNVVDIEILCFFEEWNVLHNPLSRRRLARIAVIAISVGGILLAILEGVVSNVVYTILPSLVENVKKSIQINLWPWIITGRYHTMSAADRERQLWEASQQFVRGEISSERLEQIELASSLSRQDAILAAATRRMGLYITITLITLFILVVALAAVTFVFTRNTFSFGLLFGLIPLIIVSTSLIRRLYPMGDEFYQAEALKLQKKQNSRKKSERLNICCHWKTTTPEKAK